MASIRRRVKADFLDSTMPHPRPKNPPCLDLRQRLRASGHRYWPLRDRPIAESVGMSKIKICVVGAGSIGGHLGVLFATVGHEVTVIARGAHLAAIQKNGLRLILDDGSEHLVRHMHATDEIRSAGPQDLVILAVKANQVEPIVDDVTSLFHEGTVLIPMQNGIPWWYFQRHGAAFEG